MKTIENPENVMTWTMCFAVRGEASIIDMVHPITGVSAVYGHTLEQIRERYPNAELMPYEELRAAKIAKQQGELHEWKECTEARYLDMLECVPPAAMQSGAFLVGEPYDHCAQTGKPRFACFKEKGDRFYELTGHITHKEFCALFGKTANLYIS